MARSEEDRVSALKDAIEAVQHAGTFEINPCVGKVAELAFETKDVAALEWIKPLLLDPEGLIARNALHHSDKYVRNIQSSKLTHGWILLLCSLLGVRNLHSDIVEMITPRLQAAPDLWSDGFRSYFASLSPGLGSHELLAMISAANWVIRREGFGDAVPALDEWVPILLNPAPEVCKRTVILMEAINYYRHGELIGELRKAEIILPELESSQFPHHHALAEEVRSQCLL